MENRKVLIIGGGIAGLSAGCYAQANGFSSTILEMHSLPGGLCTSWKRKGYTFDYCIHWLIGSGVKSEFRRIWDFLDIAPLNILLDHEIFVTRICDDGTPVHWYTDAVKLREHLLALSLYPEDGKLIRKLSLWIARMSTFSLLEPDSSLHGLRCLIESLPAILTMGMTKGKLWSEFAQQFKTPVLREALAAFFDMEGFPLLSVVFTLGYMHGKSAGYPLGGSLPMAQRSENKYRKLGGQIEYKKEVTEIVVENGIAVGARCKDGSEYRGDWIVSAADAHKTIYELLQNKYPSKDWEKNFNQLKTFAGPVQASFGIRLDADTAGTNRHILLGWPLDDEAPNISMKLKHAIHFEDKTIERVGFHHFAFDSSLGPSGGIPITFLFGGNTAWWIDLAKDRSAYKAEKERFLDELENALEEIIPGFKSRIEVRDLATPLTNIRYTGNFKGSQEGFLLNNVKYHFPCVLPGLANFYLCGQWRYPGGGIPRAAMDGRIIIREICKCVGKPFLG